MKHLIILMLLTSLVACGTRFESASRNAEGSSLNLTDSTPDSITDSNGIDTGTNTASGVPQKPKLLSSYKYRPPFKVAGVDYAVGLPAGMALKSPMSISMPGVNVNSSSRVVSVVGDNVTLDGYDFSNWFVETKSANTRVLRSKFFKSAVVGLSGSSNLYVGYCDIDGANTEGSVWGGLISTWSDGSTIEYNWIRNAGGDIIQQVGGHSSSLIIRYNLMEQSGMLPGTHGDYTQILAPSKVLKIIGNTIVQDGGTTQGLMSEQAESGEVGNNVMIGSMSYATSIDLSALKSTFSVHDNFYGDLGFGFVYPNSGPGDSSPFSIFTNNVNMATGARIEEP